MSFPFLSLLVTEIHLHDKRRAVHEVNDVGTLVSPSPRVRGIDSRVANRGLDPIARTVATRVTSQGSAGMRGRRRGTLHGLSTGRQSRDVRFGRVFSCDRSGFAPRTESSLSSLSSLFLSLSHPLSLSPSVSYLYSWKPRVGSFAYGDCYGERDLGRSHISSRDPSTRRQSLARSIHVARDGSREESNLRIATAPTGPSSPPQRHRLTIQPYNLFELTLESPDSS